MSRLHRFILIALVFSIVAAAMLATAGAAGTGSDRHPLAVKAEESFFAVFNGNPKVRTAPLRDLMTAHVVSPRDARVNLLLGLNHLWLAAEGDRTNPTTIDHVILAEHFLAQAQKLDPSDRRIPSWLTPTRLSLPELYPEEKDQREASRRELEAAYSEDPNFHSFTMALLSVGSARSSPEFQRGLAVLRTAIGCGGGEDPSCQNQPRWPHNREGFLTFFADYELKAGNTDRARELLIQTQQGPDYPRWRFKNEVEDRLKNLDVYAALYANADPGDDPPHLMVSGGFMCQSCHSGP